MEYFIMSYPGSKISVELSDGEQKDSFGRLRTSQPTELFSVACELDARPDFYENILISGGTATYSQDKASVDLAVSSVGDSVIRQSKQYVRYRPGKSQQIFVTGNFKGQETGVIKRMGYYDDSSQTSSTGDGIFFEVSDSGVYAVLRSSTSGSSTDLKISQENWNKDTLDGTGPSGLTIDFDKMQVCVLEFGWLGAAIVRWGFVVEGRTIIVHEEYPSNNFLVPFMSKASLPVRWEIIGYAGVTSGSMMATCASVQSEGGFNTLGVKRSTSRGSSGLSLSATNLRPLLTVRLKSGYERAKFDPTAFSLIADGDANYEILILVNAVISSSPGPLTWSPVPGSVTEFNINANNTISSYDSVISTSYGLGGGGPIKSVGSDGILASDIPIGASYNGTRDTVTIAVRPLSTSATTFFASLEWREFA
jgi:hypothetical protein